MVGYKQCMCAHLEKMLNRGSPFDHVISSSNSIRFSANSIYLWFEESRGQHSHLKRF